jgi:hypothetical protein
LDEAVLVVCGWSFVVVVLLSAMFGMSVVLLLIVIFL